MKTMTLRARIHALMDPNSLQLGARSVRKLEVLLNLLGIVGVALGTVAELSPQVRELADWVVAGVALCFFVEYLVRLWVAPEALPLQGLAPVWARVRWVVSFEGWVDLLAVMPALVTLSGGARLGAESASVFVLLWVLKLATRAPGVRLIVRVIRNEKAALSAALALFLIVLFSAATLAHWLEGQAQPQQFGSIPSSLWWTVVTFTTTGYGDVVPLTPLGRLLASAVMLSGIVVMAVLTGILATGFAEEMRRREFMRVWNLVAQVPIFAELGAMTLADIVARLRTSSYPAGSTVFYKGAEGDAMYFLVSGAVRVRLPHGHTDLHAGDFFGEMALLDRKPRSADVVTLTPCTLLVLNVADFYQLAGQQPGLMATIETQAQVRRASGGLAAQNDR